MQAELLLGTLRSTNVNTPDGQLKIKTIPTDSWLVDRVVFISHTVVIDGISRTELLVFPDSVRRHLPTHEVSTLVKLGIDTGRMVDSMAIHVVPRTAITIKSDTLDRITKQPQQPYQTQRMHLNNPYLLDFLKGIRDADGSLVALEDAA